MFIYICGSTNINIYFFTPKIGILRKENIFNCIVYTDCELEKPITQ